MLFDASKEFEVSNFPFHEVQVLIFILCIVRNTTILPCCNLPISTLCSSQYSQSFGLPKLWHERELSRFFSAIKDYNLG